MHPRLERATLLQLPFPGEGTPNFPREKSYWDNTVVKSDGEVKSQQFGYDTDRQILGMCVLGVGVGFRLFEITVIFMI